MARDPLLPLSGIRVGTWRHDQTLVDMERRLERHFGGWLEPERRIRERRRLQNSAEAHLPDAIIHRPDGELVAIELELSAKPPARLQKIVDQYAASTEFAQVVYLTDDPRLARHVKRFTGSFAEGQRVRLTLLFFLFVIIAAFLLFDEFDFGRFVDAIAAILVIGPGARKLN